jgi:hypothetical protein
MCIPSTNKERFFRSDFYSCLLWPLMLLVEGAITAYFSTVWTLAWREWTGRQFSTAVDAT